MALTADDISTITVSSGSYSASRTGVMVIVPVKLPAVILILLAEAV